MKTNLKPFILALGLGLSLLDPQTSSGYYNASTGRWLSRDPLEEDGGFNSYCFVDNEPVSGNDYLGLVIETSCDPIDDYLKSLGISYERAGSCRYTFSGTDLGTGDASAKMIVTRMLFTGTVFKVSSTGGSATDNLKKHVNARLTIVRNALRANFKFGTGEFPIDRQALSENAQSYFNKLNNGKTTMACEQLSRIIFETGNECGAQGVRRRSGPTPANLVWIPGDWGKILNKAYVFGVWTRGYEAENVIHTGTSGDGEMFWGHFKPGVQPAMSESRWFDFIRNWDGPGGGKPEWKDAVKYPLIGLERPTTPP
jgi:hypothetical protein